MEAKELRVGNLILYKGRFCDVYSVALSGDIEIAYLDKKPEDPFVITDLDINEIELIALTEEWLVKHTEFFLYKETIHNHIEGDIKTKCRYYRIQDEDVNESLNYEFIVVFVIDPETEELRNIKFEVYGTGISDANLQKDSVHLLQNAYFTVTGEELKINT